MTRSAFLLTRALPLATLLALMTTTAQAAGNPPVFYCDEKSMVDRQAEIFAIRQDFLPGLKEIIEGPPGLGEKDSAAEQHAEYTARLNELLLGVESCKELRAFEAPPTAKDKLERLRRQNAEFEAERARAELEGGSPPPAAGDDLLAPPGETPPMPAPDPDYHERRPDYEPYDPTPYDPLNPTGVTPPIRPNS